MEECPECGNKKIIMVIEEIHRKEISVMTGKVIKNHGLQGTNSWNYKCRCGWDSEMVTE